MKYLKILVAFIGLSLLFFGCSKEYSVEPGRGFTGVSGWEFTEGATKFAGPVDTAFLDTLSSVVSLYAEGVSSDGSQDFLLAVHGSEIKVGTYTAPVATLDLLQNGNIVYRSSATDFSVVITSISKDGVAGTFSGKVVNGNGDEKTITNGKFSASFGGSTPVPPAGDGQILLWSKAACSTAGTPLTVTVNGSNGTISTFSATEPACGAAGSFGATLPAGTYTWTANCGATTISGSVTVLTGACTKVQVDFANPPTNCKISVISRYNLSGTTPRYAYTATYTGNNISKWTAVDSANGNTVDVSFNVTYPAGRIQLDANNYFVVNGAGLVTEYHGLEDPSMTGSNRVILKYTYNANGQLAVRSMALESMPATILVTVTYSYTGSLLTKATVKSAGFTTHEDTYEYDAARTVKAGLRVPTFAPEIYRMQALGNFGATPDKALTRISQKTLDPISGTVVTTNVTEFGNYVIDASGFIRGFDLSGMAIGSYFFDMPSDAKYVLSYKCF